jgi:tetratricopeptide (TPR) repeat protein
MSIVGDEGGEVSLASNARELVERGNRRLDMGDLDGAFESYNAALELEPEWVDALMGRVDVHYRRHDLAPAGDEVAQALELDPDNLRARRMRGIILEARALYPEALADYKAVASEAPTADAFRNLGDVELALDEAEAAEADYSRALELDPEYAPGYFGRGCARGRLKHYEAAIADFTHALDWTQPTRRRDGCAATATG